MLIVLVAIHPAPSPQSVPLANAFLTSYAASSSVHIKLIDIYLHDDLNLGIQRICAESPDAIGFSCYVWNADMCCTIAAQLNKLTPSTLLFCGGPEVTASPRTFIINTCFDCAIVGEGEVPFASLCHALTNQVDIKKLQIPGLLFAGSDDFLPVQPIENLDTIPSPYLTGVIDTHTTSGLLWQLSRGCTFACTFCYDARGAHGVRHFSLSRLEAELQHFAATQVAQVFVLDSTFNSNKRRAKILLKMIRDIAPEIHFHFEVRSEFLDKEMARLFAEISCSLQIGLQSADPKALAKVGRTFNKNDFTIKISLLNDCGAVFGFDLIYGLPGDSLAGFTRSLDYALSLYPNHLDIFPLAVLPGTQLADQAAEFGLVWNVLPPYIVQSSTTFSQSDMISAAKLATACDIFYTRGKSVAWFNALATLLRLSPSGLLSSFAQWLSMHHEKTVSEQDVSDEDVLGMQVAFITHLLSTPRHKKYTRLVLDVVRYHHYYASIVLGTEQSTFVERSDSFAPAKPLYYVADSTRLLHFNHDIELLLDCGEPQFAWMYTNIPQNSTYALLYRNNAEICTETIAEPYFALLSQLQSPPFSFDSAKAGLSSRQADEFISFAVAEQIIIKR